MRRQTAVATYTFPDVNGKRVSVQLDLNLPVHEAVARLNTAGGGVLWRVTPEGRAEFIQQVGSCPMRNKQR
jgi:hypothetical protein